LGHHLNGTNIEQIVSILLMEGKSWQVSISTILNMGMMTLLLAALTHINYS
jgi:hypothetical protein